MSGKYHNSPKKRSNKGLNDLNSYEEIVTSLRNSTQCRSHLEKEGWEIYDVDCEHCGLIFNLGVNPLDGPVGDLDIVCPSCKKITKLQ